MQNFERIRHLVVEPLKSRHWFTREIAVKHFDGYFFFSDGVYFSTFKLRINYFFWTILCLRMPVRYNQKIIRLFCKLCASFCGLIEGSTFGRDCGKTTALTQFYFYSWMTNNFLVQKLVHWAFNEHSSLKEKFIMVKAFLFGATKSDIQYKDSGGKNGRAIVRQSFLSVVAKSSRWNEGK